MENEIEFKDFNINNISQYATAKYGLCLYIIQTVHNEYDLVQFIQKKCYDSNLTYIAQSNYKWIAVNPNYGDETPLKNIRKLALINFKG